MKRTALLAAAALVAVTPALASAAPKGPRTLSYDYQGFQAVHSSAVGSGSLEDPCAAVDSCWDFTTVKGEKTIKLTIADGTGAAGFQVWTDDDYTGTVTTFCGTGEIKVSPKTAAAISVRPSASPDCQAVPTSGTLTAVITKA